MYHCTLTLSVRHSFVLLSRRPTSSIFFFNDTATTEIYTLSLHDALPISAILFGGRRATAVPLVTEARDWTHGVFLGSIMASEDRKSTRLNSSHSQNSYAVFCLKKKKSAHSTQCPVATPYVSSSNPDRTIF